MAFVRKSPRQVLQTSSRQRSDASISEQSLERHAKAAASFTPARSKQLGHDRYIRTLCSSIGQTAVTSS